METTNVQRTANLTYRWSSQNIQSVLLTHFDSIEENKGPQVISHPESHFYFVWFRFSPILSTWQNRSVFVIMMWGARISRFVHVTVTAAWIQLPEENRLSKLFIRKNTEPKIAYVWPSSHSSYYLEIVCDIGVYTAGTVMKSMLSKIMAALARALPCTTLSIRKQKYFASTSPLLFVLLS